VVEPPEAILAKLGMQTWQECYANIAVATEVICENCKNILMALEVCYNC
jgi:hypothetical protein